MPARPGGVFFSAESPARVPKLKIIYVAYVVFMQSNIVCKFSIGYAYVFSLS
jgi:hypothetical protein